MIEIGKRYILATLELGDDGYEKGTIGVTVTARDGNLLEVNGCEIINMNSPLFHSLTNVESKNNHLRQVEEELFEEK